ncbi:hypothetical protein LRP30_31330 [Bradyrhizobium sp. C-145]|nr:hypothetical protein [Bradyrhizobium sp. C-145]UQR61395.1 hypothetical protein LRP30_31330 [Bradyrhizobium sp. C-145]
MDNFNVRPVAQEQHARQSDQVSAFEQQVQPFLSDDLCSCYPVCPTRIAD